MVPPGGFSRGEQFERERVVPPLSRLLCVLSCRSKKVRPRWQALAESRLENRLKGYNRVSIPTGKYHPKIKPSAFRPQAPSVTCGDSSLPEGAAAFRRIFPYSLTLPCVDTKNRKGVPFRFWGYVYRGLILALQILRKNVRVRARLTTSEIRNAHQTRWMFPERLSR